MKPKFISALVLSVLTFCLNVSAQTVSPEAARAKATDFFSTGARNLPAKKGVKRQAPAVGNIELAYTSEKDGKTCFYVFNNGDDGGFVIVGGDEKVQTVLAYNLSGHIDIENASENFKWWINTTEKSISKSLLSGGKYFVVNKSDTYVEPLITTKWGQGYPYNLKTPVGTLNNGDKINCQTGCVATAMAQVMNYHKFPDHGIGSKNYQILISGTGEKQEISYDFSSVNFDWDNMCDTYTEDNTDVEKDAVATLMYACGVSVDMEYDLHESGAQTSKVIPALHNTFGYSAYQVSSSFQSIKSELDEGCPLIYSGTGHMLVIDGYDKDGYLYLNMGWNGLEDGYYAIDHMNGYAGGTFIAVHKPYNDDVSDYEWYELVFDLDGKDHTASLKGPINHEIVKANIPDSVYYKGSYYKVTSMQSDAFFNCSSLQSVVIPQSVEFIPTYAFMGCEKLATIVLPEGLKSIEVQAFSYCPALKNIIIPSTVTNIANHAFFSSGLQEITIPKDAMIGLNPFCECYELSSINIDEASPYYYYSDGGVYEKLTNNLLCVAGGYGQTMVIKEGTRVIETSACAGTSISEFVFPNSLITIGLGAFNNNNSIKRIVLPESLKSFYCSFYECNNLEYISIPASVSYIAFDEHEFKSCENLKTIDIAPDNPYYIVEDGVVFNQDKTILYKAGVDLKDDYVVPITVNEVATGAFENCNDLHHINLSSVKYLGGTFGSVFIDCKNLESIIIPEGVLHLPMHTFSGCCNLSEISLPSTLVAAHPSAFRLCHNLKYIDVHFQRPLPDTDMGGFELFGDTSKGVAYVPKGTKAYFENDNVWKDLTIVEKDINPDAVLADSVAFVNKVEFAHPWDTLQFKATVYPENASQEIVWATNCGQSYGARVDDNGLVTIDSPYPGTFTVFAMTKDGSNVYASCNIEVNEQNGDGNVTLADMPPLLTYLLTGNASEVNLRNADVNGDGVVSIADLTALIKKLQDVNQ